jgi:putative PIN family toxin of toxin-antitoxin system
MKVVLDTNVVVSAFLSPAGKPAAILAFVLRHDFDICFDTAILAEYEQVLSRSKFAGKMRLPAIRRFFDLMKNFGINTIADPSQTNMPDETDRKFYDIAKAAGAVLVTGNKKHYPDEPFIKDPTEFLAQLSSDSTTRG